LKGFRSLVPLLAVGLLAGACTRSGTGNATDSPSTSPRTTQVAAPVTGDFGTLKAVCGPGHATGATDKYVTDTSIDVGTMADPGAQASPGLDQELFDTAAAFVKWCNAAGGILGRKLTLHLHDAKLFEVPARMLDACSQDFALVGDGTAFDNGGVAPRVACGLPELPAYDNSPEATNAPLVVQATPTPTSQAPVYLYLGVQHMFPGTTRIGFITGTLAGILVTRDRYKEAAGIAGMTTVYNETYPVTGVDNWRPYVQKMKDNGAQVVMLTGDSLALVGMEKSMKDLNWYPKAIVESVNMYDQRVIKEGGDAIQNTWVSSSFYPFERAKDNPATQQYLDTMAKYNPGGKVAALGVNAMSSWLLFATAARNCGSDLTRSCLLSKAAADAAWTGGGLGAPVNTSVTNRQTSQCDLALKATPTGFEIDPSFLPPNQGSYNCSPANVVNLKGDYTKS